MWMNHPMCFFALTRIKIIQKDHGFLIGSSLRCGEEMLNSNGEGLLKALRGAA